MARRKKPRRLVVSAGPTHEHVDPVRYLGNESSGKMGFEIARAAARRGDEVLLRSALRRDRENMRGAEPASKRSEHGVEFCRRSVLE